MTEGIEARPDTSKGREGCIELAATIQEGIIAEEADTIQSFLCEEGQI
jgi:hypothetical protein